MPGRGRRLRGAAPAPPAGCSDRVAGPVEEHLHPRDLSEGQRLSLALAVVLAGAPPAAAAGRADPRPGLPGQGAARARSCASWPPPGTRRPRDPRRRAGRRGGRARGRPRRRRGGRRRPRPRGARRLPGVRAAGRQDRRTRCPSSPSPRSPRPWSRRREPGAARAAGAAAAGRTRCGPAGRRWSRWPWSRSSASVAFGWPFLAGPEVGLAHGHDAPWLFALLTGLLALVTLAEVAAGGLDAKTDRGARRARRHGRRAAGAQRRDGRARADVLPARAGRPGARAAAWASCSGRSPIVTGAFLTGGVGPVDAVPDDHRRLGRARRRAAAPGLRPASSGRCSRRTGWSPACSTAP